MSDQFSKDRSSGGLKFQLIGSNDFIGREKTVERKKVKQQSLWNEPSGIDHRWPTDEH